jgi:hypothetical protein
MLPCKSLPSHDARKFVQCEPVYKWIRDVDQK